MLIDQTPMTPPAGTIGAHPLDVALTRWEQAQAEAEAAADVMYADPDREVRVAAPRQRRFVRAVELSEAELAEAECSADLCHVDDVL